MAIKSKGYAYGSDVPLRIGDTPGEGPPNPGSSGGWNIPVTRADFPVGTGTIPVLPPRRLLPPLVPPIVRVATAGVLNPPARRGSAPPPPVIPRVAAAVEPVRPVMINGTFVGRDEVVEFVNGAWRRVGGPVSISPIKQTGAKSMDLGDLIGTLGTELIKAKYSPSTVMGPQPAGYTFPTSGALATTPALGVPFVDVIPEAGDCGRAKVWNPRANNGAGKWINRSRRRRKRLATSSDIRDIGALKSVLSPAELKTWIATHS